MKNRGEAALAALFIGLLSGCATAPAAPSSASSGSASEPRLVVEVQDDTDKAYISDVGDESSLYRDIATQVAGALSANGVAASAYDAPDAHRLTVHIVEERLTNRSSGSSLDVELRTDLSAEIDDWSQSYQRDDTVQRTVPGGVSPSTIRDLLAAQITQTLTADEDLFKAARKVP